MLIAPFGKGTVELSTRAGAAHLRTHDNRRLSGDSAAELLWRHFGWRLPVGGLPYWIRGLPQPDTRIEALILDERQQLRQLRQSGWDIRYSDYRRVDDYLLPAKMRLENSALRVKLAVTAWTLEQ